MKTRIFFLFLITFVYAYEIEAQTAMLSVDNSNEQNITNLKSFDCRYFSGSVYMHLKVNGNTETKILTIERSIDAENFEVIGYLKIFGVSASCDLSYYFTDDAPVSATLYYRLSDLSCSQEPVYSSIVSINPVENGEDKGAPKISVLNSVQQEASLAQSSTKAISQN